MRKTNNLFKILITIVLGVLSSVVSAQTSRSLGPAYDNTQDPVELSSARALVELSANSTDWGLNFILTDDIDMTGMTFTPIGTGGTIQVNFTGNFDGAGHIISNLTVTDSDPSATNGANGIALFGQIAGSTIQNLGIENISVISPTDGDERVAGVVANLNSGTVQNCYVKGGNIQGKYRVAGIAGYNNGGTVTNCWSSAAITYGSAAWNHGGGIVGTNAGAVSACAFYGTITPAVASNNIGGIVGKNEGAGSVVNCFYINTITSVGTGIAGVALSDVDLADENSYTGFDFVNTWVMDPVAPNYAVLQKFNEVVVVKPTVSITGPADGTSYSIGDDITVTATVAPNGTSASPIASVVINIGDSDVPMTLVAGFDYTYTFTTTSSPYTINVTVTDSDNEFSSSAITIDASPTYSGGDGSEGDPYQISTAADLMALSGWSAHWTSDFIQTANIDMSGKEFKNIGHGNSQFTGDYNGQYYTISNLTSTSVQEGQSVTGGGLFGVTLGASISNVGLINPSITLTTQERVGAIVGELGGGSLTNCFVMGGTVNAAPKGRVGGVVGYTPSGAISNVFSSCTVNAGWTFGGIIGQLGWDAAWASGSSLSNCVFDGTTAGKSVIGAKFSLGAVPVVVSGAYYSDGAGVVDEEATLLLEASALLEASYSEFDFTKDWGISAADGIAVLRGFPIFDVQIAKFNLEIAGDLANVTSNLTLLDALDGTTITWNSSNLDAVGHDGVLAGIVADDVTVQMTATITSGTESTTKVFDVTIKAGVYTSIDSQALNISSLTVSPNPVNSVLTLSESVLSASVYSINGTLLKSVRNTATIEVSDLSAGIYFLRANNEIVKFVKQ